MVIAYPLFKYWLDIVNTRSYNFSLRWALKMVQAAKLSIPVLQNLKHCHTFQWQYNDHGKNLEYKVRFGTWANFFLRDNNSTKQKNKAYIDNDTILLLVNDTN